MGRSLQVNKHRGISEKRWKYRKESAAKCEEKSSTEMTSGSNRPELSVKTHPVVVKLALDW